MTQHLAAGNEPRGLAHLLETFMRHTTYTRLLFAATVITAAAPTLQAQRAGSAAVTQTQMRARPGHDGLMAGITLTPEQRQQMRALRGTQGARGAEMKAEVGQIRSDRASHNFADARKMRQEMRGQRVSFRNSIRAILTPEQRIRFDANIAGARAEKKGQRGQHGGR